MENNNKFTISIDVANNYRAHWLQLLPQITLAQQNSSDRTHN